ncbi:hypothetical protein [Atopobium sp. oral taxon 416]|uniref:hypothetical protein n=1 Tax=Atopobium sp. oral taxon 416 TaxID=712157 RepID=UPI001BA98AD9|nr:hypothetical protein [Atopobium sp. oral taxon 416]QUC02572.1 hypothetical protein J4859_11060 [Atopobium sp. oral taxon 416]
MDRHWSLEEIDYISGSRVAAGAPLSLPTILTGRSVAAALDLPEAGPQGQVRRHLRRKGKRIRSKRPKIRGKIEILHSVKERPKQADARSCLGEWEDDTLVAAGPMCLLVLADRALRLLAAKRATTTAGVSLRPRSGCCRDVPLRRSLLSGASSSQGIQSSQRPWETCSSTSATPTIYGRS